ncbi:hypothetical protein COCOBI_07-1430 [Coccomyxa sp. Obi]|nr:hypothetical protein COCOBI_07-1430 [Coccomyxa sp. Obi]
MLSTEETSEQSEDNTAVRLAWRVVKHLRTRAPSHVRAIISVADSSCTEPASAAAAMLQFTQANHEALAKDNIRVMAIDTAGCISSEGVAEAALLPLHPDKQPSEIPVVLALKDFPTKHQDGDAAGSKTSTMRGPDEELMREGVDTGPNPEGTLRHDNPEEAVYISSEHFLKHMHFTMRETCDCKHVQAPNIT